MWKKSAFWAIHHDNKVLVLYHPIKKKMEFPWWAQDEKDIVWSHIKNLLTTVLREIWEEYAWWILIQVEWNLRIDDSEPFFIDTWENTDRYFFAMKLIAAHNLTAKEIQWVDILHVPVSPWPWEIYCAYWLTHKQLQQALDMWLIKPKHKKWIEKYLQYHYIRHDENGISLDEILNQE